MATIRLTYQSVENAVSYNIYFSRRPGLSTAFTPLLANTTHLTYDYTPVGTGHFFFIVAPVGPNGEIGPASNEFDAFI